MILWEPAADARSTTVMGGLWDDIEKRTGRTFGHYDEMWEWSVANLDEFYGILVDHLGVRFTAPPETVVTDHSMPGARWFPASTLNYVDHVLAGEPGEVVVESWSQTRGPVELTRAELRDHVARVRGRLIELGVRPGDRVAVYMPNISETMVVLLASASLGAIFLSCPPEFGVGSVVDRLAQVEPAVLVVVDGYRFGDKTVDRVDDVAAIRAALPTVRTTVVVPYLDRQRAAAIPDAVSWEWVLQGAPDPTIDPLPFDHPLYILFSSGSTGTPKPIVHTHGGITVEHLKWLAVHSDLKPGDVSFWPTTTAWMTWNTVVSSLLCGARTILFDGDPTEPDLPTFWRFVADRRVTHLGVSPPLLQLTRTAGVVPAHEADLSALRVVSSGGSPLSESLYHWVYEAVGSDLMLASVSGGTDTCAAFVGGNPLRPVRAGEITCRFLGTEVQAYGDDGTPIVGEQGELVVTKPIPSMPLQLWGDSDGSRLQGAYYDRYPGVWYHGDWITITEHGSAIISGRSDATLNRGGVRMGTQELYSAVEAVHEVADSLVIHLEDPDGGLGELLMFVSLTPGAALDEAVRSAIRDALRRRLSPRYVPNEIIEVSEIPRTIAGKRFEVPVKRLLKGTVTASRIAGALSDPRTLDPFVELAKKRQESV
ncbi:acetoacetate--CoA ligase [Cryptosporangium sp. NPDC051539]|uniref:acetoacetate--CoA ligase n=1 Tax=Cryptosporangium sp. NPDC051539 TaxID=3363962 RepID=UPI0037AF19BD